MARNSVKAQSMLFRFREQQAADLGIIDAGRTRKLIGDVDVRKSSQVVKEISRKVSKIQDPSLSDYQIRDLNDAINKLMREKHMWEVQLRNLGGPNYMRFAPKIYDDEGREVPGNRGYRYFGRARELPGVRELFEEIKPKPKNTEVEKKASESIRKFVDADYYGYNRDEEDGVLLEYERKKEEEAKRNTLEKSGGPGGGGSGEPRAEWAPIPDGWKVPGREEVMEHLLERRKNKLLQKLV
ncbi:Isy1-like splicing factor [Terfezia boudieri ATCC MYA-4762]|uniref:Isy1-like splicing factor n=1 Tax=Terfezia boudieri ATCC MYA-4762 TaxID=1051890 RepID=A0A3N4LB69_9PEZI|nr:Isy1-like splicing factor [Terfezia boudieri ATCC MYA-4762]